MRRILLMCAAMTTVALWHAAAEAQERSVLRRTPQLAAPLAAAPLLAPQLAAPLAAANLAENVLQDEPTQGEPIPAGMPPSAGPSTTPGPVPDTYAVPASVWVLQPVTYAVPMARWGLFHQRLIPKTVYVRRYEMRPAQVSGPYYLIR